jgi:hypothetical protein
MIWLIRNLAAPPEMDQVRIRRSILHRLLKNAHLRRSSHPSSLQRTFKYASLLRISGALHLGIFDHPEKNEFFNRLLNLDDRIRALDILELAEERMEPKKNAGC